MRRPGNFSVWLAKVLLHSVGAAVATHITDHMRVSQVDAKCGGRVDASIHAGHYSAGLVWGLQEGGEEWPHTNKILLCRRQGEIALGKGGCIFFARGDKILLYGSRHCELGFI